MIQIPVLPSDPASHSISGGIEGGIITTDVINTETFSEMNSRSEAGKQPSLPMKMESKSACENCSQVCLHKLRAKYLFCSLVRFCILNCANKHEVLVDSFILSYFEE